MWILFISIQEALRLKGIWNADMGITELRAPDYFQDGEHMDMAVKTWP